MDKMIKTPYQIVIHLFEFADKISEKFRHVFLFSSIQRLFVHGVCLAKGSRIVGFSVAFLFKKTYFYWLPNNDANKKIDGAILTEFITVIFY